MYVCMYMFVLIRLLRSCILHRLVLFCFKRMFAIYNVVNRFSPHVFSAEVVKILLRLLMLLFTVIMNLSLWRCSRIYGCRRCLLVVGNIVYNLIWYRSIFCWGFFVIILSLLLNFNIYNSHIFSYKYTQPY